MIKRSTSYSISLIIDKMLGIDSANKRIKATRYITNRRYFQAINNLQSAVNVAEVMYHWKGGEKK